MPKDIGGLVVGAFMMLLPLIFGGLSIWFLVKGDYLSALLGFLLCLVALILASANIARYVVRRVLHPKHS